MTAGTDVALAEAEAREAEELVRQLEKQALHADPESRPTGEQVAGQRAAAEFARRRVAVTRDRAAAAAAAAGSARSRRSERTSTASQPRPPYRKGR